MSRNNIQKIKEYCSKIFRKDNITGGIFNFCYLSPEEMEQALNIKKEAINVIENLKLVNCLIQKHNIISQDTNYIIGIEGLDYLNEIEDIDELYKLGMRSTNIVWNNRNKFGGGAKSDEKDGLTNLGEELVEKLVKTNIAIDLSHTNEKTFWGIIEQCKRLRKQGYIPIIHASHSNSKTICDVPRNLSDEQIKAIAEEFDGTIGIVGYTPFVVNAVGVAWHATRAAYHAAPTIS